MFRFFIVLACLFVVTGYGLSPKKAYAPLGSKKASTPAPVPVPVKAVPAPKASLFGAKKVAAPAPAPVAVKAAPAPKASLFGAKKVAAPAPAAAPVKKAAAPAPAAAAVKKAAAPAPVKKAAPIKKAAPAPIAANPDFAFGLDGVSVELGEFDPFSLSTGRSEETVSWYRAAELKHGRVCMLAFLGLLTSPLFHLPDAVFESRGGIDAVTKLYNERPEALWQIILALGAIETFTLFKNGQGQAGDLGFDPLNFKAKYENDPNMQLKELKNGRLAMLGTSAILIQEALSGKGVYDQL